MSENNDDLQNAINGIVNGAADSAAPVADDAAAAVPDLGEAPVPPMTPEEAPAEMQLPSMPVPDPAAGLMNAAPEAIEDQAAIDGPAPGVVPDPVDGTLSETAVDEIKESVENMPTNGKISDVKRDMISDLIPLMDKVAIAPEKQFGLYKELIDATHDKDLVPGAYVAAKKMTDDKDRAEALLYLIDESE